jgi:hypothetical protein
MAVTTASRSGDVLDATSKPSGGAGDAVVDVDAGAGAAAGADGWRRVEVSP